MASGIFGDLVGAIDEGTSSARFVIFKAGTADIVCFHQLELRQITPSEGWVEQDAPEILRVVEECIDKSVEKLIALGGYATVSTAVLQPQKKINKNTKLNSSGYCGCRCDKST